MTIPIGQQELFIEEGAGNAIASLNAHDHSGGLGAPITNGGLADDSVSSSKIQDDAILPEHISAGAVGNEEIADGSVSISKLSPDVGLATSGGALTVTNYVGEGLKLVPDFSALKCTITSGRSNISEKFQRLVANTDLTLEANKASLVYAQKNLLGDSPIIDKLNANYPELDSTHVARWLFNDRYLDTQILDTTANANHLVAFGGSYLIDGWFNKSIKFDGTTGYYKSLLTTGLPTALNPREVTAVFTVTNNVKQQVIFSYGNVTTLNGMCVWIYNGRWYIGAGCETDTGVRVLAGRTYCVTLQYTGKEYRLYINGNLMYRLVGDYALTTNTTNFLVGTYANNLATTTQLFTGIMHYLEVRNVARTKNQIASMSNKILLPCRYTGSLATYPEITQAGSHVWKFNDTDPTVLVDSNVGGSPLNGIAHAGNTGLQHYPSELLLGNARRFNGGTNDYFDCGILPSPAEFTITGVIRLNSYGSGEGNIIISNYATAVNTGIALAVNSSGKLSIYSLAQGAWVVLTDKIIPLNMLTWFAVTFKNGKITSYLTTCSVDSSLDFTFSIGGGGNLTIGSYTGSSGMFKGTMEYLALIPVALTFAEISKLYSSLSAVGNRSIREDALPADSISLGFLRTDSNRVIEYDDSVFLYGRKEGINKVVTKFIGWNYATTSSNYYPENPFQTDKVRVTQLMMKDTVDLCRGAINDMMYNTGNGYEYGGTIRDITPFYFHVGFGQATTNWQYDVYGNLYGFWMEVDD